MQECAKKKMMERHDDGDKPDRRVRLLFTVIIMVLGQAVLYYYNYIKCSTAKALSLFIYIARCRAPHV